MTFKSKLLIKRLKTDKNMVCIAWCVPTILLVLTVVSSAMGTAFINQGITASNEMKMMTQREKVTLDLYDKQIKKGGVVDSLEELLAAGNIPREHNQKIVQTYGDLLGGGTMIQPILTI